MAVPLRKVALVGGSGKLGSHILNALVADPAVSLTLITRHTSTNTYPSTIPTIKVSDGYPPEEMVSAFKGQDAVVLNLGWSSGQHQLSLIDSSVTAGVKRLVASIYGGNDSNKKGQELFPLAASNAKIIEECKAREKPGWSWTAIYCGLFFDFCVSNSFFGMDPIAHKATIWDSGTATFSATNVAVVGLSVAKVLSLPELTANKAIYISSFETCMNDILAAYKKGTGVEEWDVEYVKFEDQIEKGREMLKGGDFWGMGKLAFGAQVGEGFEADFRKEGLLDNELLGIEEEESVEESVRRVLKDKFQIG